MKPDMTAAEHLQQCCACNHGRTPCQEYQRVWPAKPGIECSKCGMLIFWLKGTGWITASGAEVNCGGKEKSEHEPVSGPTPDPERERNER